MFQHPGVFKNGEWQSGQGLALRTYNPATQDLLWTGNEASSTQVNEAVDAAKTAFLSWSNSSIDERASFLKNFAIALKEQLDPFAEIISQETGKPLWDAKNELLAVIQKTNLSFEAYNTRCGDIKKSHPHGLSMTRHRPHGPIGVLGPYNFPAHLPHGHIIPALLAGNTIVLKPSEKTPWISEKLLSLWEAIGLPPGVLNLTQGGQAVGEQLATHPDIQGVFFTGSSKVGLALSKICAAQPGKILALEMGGNNPLVVGKINDPLAAAYIAIQSAYLTSGQRCTCARRLILVRNKMNEELVHAFLFLATHLSIGPYTSIPEPFMGPVISLEAAHACLIEQEKLMNNGGKPLLKMQRIQPQSAFLSPGIIDVTDVKIKEDLEIFAPFLQLTWVNTLQEGIDEANRTRYGLSAGILTESREEQALFYQHIKAGIVNWNTPLTGASSAMPFGGIGLSGNHRPSAYYAADYCSYPVASIENPLLSVPETLLPGVVLHAL